MITSRDQIHCGHLYMHYLIWFFLFLFSALNERQRAILEEFVKEEISNENSTSAEENW